MSIWVSELAPESLHVDNASEFQTLKKTSVKYIYISLIISVFWSFPGR